MYRHQLTGCSSTPLAAYLKALGVLRLVSHQKDPHCRGAWNGSHFELLTALDAAELESFFLEEYAPTAIVAPWSRGSGFFDAENADHRAIEDSTAPRFDGYRRALAQAKELIADLQKANDQVLAIKAEVKAIKNKAQRKQLESDPEFKARKSLADKQYKQCKENFLPLCRKLWRGSHLDWLTTALVITPDGTPRYPALLGSGGNDGRFDFTKHFLGRLLTLFDARTGAPHPEAAPWLRAALWQEPAREHDNTFPAGQFLPASAGGINSATGMDSQSAINPWDFVLTLEGALFFAPAVTRRLNTQDTVGASAPFALFSRAAGWGSLCTADESPRGEQWMPLWSQPATAQEVQFLLKEGRAKNGKQPAADPVDMALAVGRLGTVRGVDAFERYAYLERNGQANLAVSLGRVPVRLRPQASLADDFTQWAHRLHGAARDKDAPARLQHAERALADALFDLLTHDPSPTTHQRVLLAAARVEKIQALGTARHCGPIPRLSPGWLAACDDGTSTYRLACTLGATAALGKTNTLRPLLGPFDDWGSRYVDHSVRHVAFGNDPVADLVAIVQRRAVEAAGHDTSLVAPDRHRRLPIAARTGWGASLADLAAWCTGQVDAQRCLDLARAFLAVDWKQVRGAAPQTGQDDMPPEPFLAVRLSALAEPIDNALDLHLDPAIVRRLAAGDATGAVQLAARRLAAKGVATSVSFAVADPPIARLWAAALAFPIDQYTARVALRHIALQTPTQEQSPGDQPAQR